GPYDPRPLCGGGRNSGGGTAMGRNDQSSQSAQRRAGAGSGDPRARSHHGVIDRRALLMGGIGMGLAVAGSGTLLLASRSAGAEDFPVVGWGDSLTAGIGATEGHDYLSQAAAAFDPHRSI